MSLTAAATARTHRTDIAVCGLLWIFHIGSFTAYLFSDPELLMHAQS